MRRVMEISLVGAAVATLEEEIVLDRGGSVVKDEISTRR